MSEESKEVAVGVDLLTTEVVAVLVALDVSGTPCVLTVGAPGGVPALPSGPLLADHRSLQVSLAAWVAEQTGHHLGFVEQLYTFADRERVDAHSRVISVSYLGLTRMGRRDVGWRRWYDLFPWEDHREPEGVDVASALVGPLCAWADAGLGGTVEQRRRRIEEAFGVGSPWRPEACLSRYELLWEAGLIPESANAGRPVDLVAGVGTTLAAGVSAPDVAGHRMRHDHRRILATGMARLRGKIQYRPVAFDLLPEEFTLGQLQLAIEALSGTRLHKQNFRRLVESQALVEETGRTTKETGGRPAKLVRYREGRSDGDLRLPTPLARPVL